MTAARVNINLTLTLDADRLLECVCMFQLGQRRDAVADIAHTNNP
jgi:hypothetical protein